MATLQWGPRLTGHLLGPLSAPGDRLLEAALLGLSVEKTGLSSEVRMPQNVHFRPSQTCQEPLPALSKREEPRGVMPQRGRGGDPAPGLMGEVRRGDPGHPSKGSVGPLLLVLGTCGKFHSP